MAEFQKVVKERDRLCRSHRAICSECPLFTGWIGITCRKWVLENPGKAEEIIMKWSEGHPIITNEKRFEEVFGMTFDDLRSRTREFVTRWETAEYKGGDNHD